MASAKGRMLRLLGGLVLREARVAAADDVSPGFRRLALRGEDLHAEPGDKLQVLLGSDEVRTYSPVPTSDGVVLLGWCHARGPGARWFAAVEAGSAIRCLGAQRSLVLPKGPVIVVGDETSVAVAASFEASRPGEVHAVFEAESAAALRSAANSVGVRPAHVTARGDVAGIVDAVVAARARSPEAALALSGGSALVLAVRSALRDRGIRDVKTKTYWVPGKAGLD